MASAPEIETTLADKLCDVMPGMDMVRFVNSGTEATMSAIRLARGYTGRDKIIKFEGCYHGHSDSLLVKAGSGALTLGVPSSPGVPAALADHTVTLTYNDIDGVKQAFSEIGDQVACVIVEPLRCMNWPTDSRFWKPSVISVTRTAVYLFSTKS